MVAVRRIATFTHKLMGDRAVDNLPIRGKRFVGDFARDA